MALRLPRCHLLTSIAGLKEEVMRRLPGLDLCVLDPANVSADEVRAAEVLLGDPALLKLQLANLRECRWIQSSWAGVESLVDFVRAQDARPAWRLTRFAGFFGPAMSQFVLAAILARERRVMHYAALQRRVDWGGGEPRNGTYRMLGDLSVGILGAGEIGSEVGRTLKHIGMRTSCLVRSPPERNLSAAFDEVHVGMEKLGEVLRQSDYVVNILPSTPSTRGLLSLEALSVCKDRNTYFINVGRGDIVPDDEVWAEAADQGFIAGATLDVFRKEPLPKESALWAHPKIQIFPHVAAMSFPADVATLFAQNLRLYTQDPALLRHQVDLSRGY